MNTPNIFHNYNLENCTKCTACTTVCPVVTHNKDFLGPKHSGPDGMRLRFKSGLLCDDNLKLCMNCKRCEVACPSGVEIADMIQTARIEFDKKHYDIKNLRNFTLSNTDLVGTMATTFAPIVNPILKTKIARKMMDLTMQIDHRRIFPEYASQTFESWYKSVKEEQDKYERQVSYFHGCYANYNNPQLGRDLVKVMNALGIGVQLLEKEKCCGVALIANGFYKQATKQAKINLASIRKSVEVKNAPVVATSSTCTMTLRDEYANLLKEDVSGLREHINLATRFVFTELMKNPNALKFKNDKKLRVAYHTACHMEKMGWAYYSIELLRKIPNLEVIVMDQECCGIAGTYGFKKENYEGAQAVGSKLFKIIEDAQVDFVACDCETCKWQIEMSTPKECLHPISILADMLA